MTPQVQTILSHLEKHVSLSQAEASLIYKIRALPRRIADLKAEGYNIKSELKKDATGQRYARYTLLPKGVVNELKVGGEYRDLDGVWAVKADEVEAI